MGYCVRKAKSMLKRKIHNILTDLVPRVHRRRALAAPMNFTYMDNASLDLIRTPSSSTSLSDPVNSITYTHRSVSNFSHLWVLDNFKTYLEDPDPVICLQSGTFSPPDIRNDDLPSAPSSHPMEWKITCYPKGTYGGITPSMNLQLEYVRGQKDVKAKAKFFIISEDEDEEIEVSKDSAFCVYKPGVSSCNSGSRSHASGSVRHETLLSALGRRDRLRILVKISIMDDPVTECVRYDSQSGIVEDSPVEDNLHGDLHRMFETGHLADVEIKVDYDPFYGLGRTLDDFPEKEHYKAHTLVLSARSPVFNAMLTGCETREKSSKVIEIKDFKPGTILSMLRFMYSGRLDDSADLLDLFRVADKYDICDLRRLLEVKLAACISCENAAEMLLMSDLRRSELLRTRALEFIARYPDEVLSSDGWNRYVACEPRLVTEVVRATASFSY